MVSTPGRVSVAIVGGGPRGLWAAEELFELARQRGIAVDLTVFNDGPVGAACAYETSQPDQWLLNVPHGAISTQLAQFSQWTDAPQPAPRKHLGQFLEESWNALCQFSPRRCTLTWVDARVEGIARRDDGWEVVSPQGATVVEELLLTTGHAEDWPGSLAHAAGLSDATGARIIAPATPDALASVTADDIVVVRGAALTFIDITRAISARAVYPVSRSGRFMEAKHEPKERIGDLVDAAEHAIRTAESMGELTQALEELAVGILQRHGMPPSLEEVRSVLAGTDGSNPVQDLRRSITAPLTPAHAVGIAFRKAYPAIIQRSSFGGRASLEGFTQFTRRLERVAFGPFIEPATDLLGLIDAGIVHTDILDRGGDETALVEAAREVGATVIIDGVIAPPGVVPGTLVGNLVDQGIGTVDPETHGLIIDRDGTIVGQKRIAAAGRMTEGWVLGLDTLNRTQHDEIPRWARRVITEAQRAHDIVHGIPPMTARIEDWAEQLTQDAAECVRLIETHSSPVNVLNPGPMMANVNELVTAGAAMGVDVRVFFARKANKALVFVDAVRDAGHGVDVASENELRQVVARGVPGERIILSAAIKPDALLELAVANGVVISADNVAELERIIAIAGQRTAFVAPRLAPDPDMMPATRFGERSSVWAKRLVDPTDPVHVVGVHVHLHGYAAADRSAALRECMALVDDLRQAGHAPEFIDVGGGVPMTYLPAGEGEQQWSDYHDLRQAFLAGYAREFTWKGDPLTTTYPYFQQPTRGHWLQEVLAGGIAEGLTERGLRLHLEPGRSLLDGCGLILATVEFVKRRSDGLPLVGLAMNRTQCRTTSDDYLVDPILVPASAVSARGTSDQPASQTGTEDTAGQEVEAFLVGAYCIEDEVILRRRIRFPNGVNPGDIIAIPNTAGYFMHILESASHQIPLAKNVVWPPGELDLIDQTHS